jgi:DNA-binding phage protein
MPRAELFDAADYLGSPENIAAYLAEALESCDPLAIDLAKAAVARALVRGIKGRPPASSRIDEQ